MIRFATKKANDSTKPEDDTLFGLLSSYKIYNTYFKLLYSNESDKLIIISTDNPKKWLNIITDRYKNFTSFRRLDIGIPKLFVKYLSPQHLILHFGSLLGFKIPPHRATIINNLDKDGYFIIETSLKYKYIVFQGIKRIINLTPQKKYEILEKQIAEAGKR